MSRTGVALTAACAACAASTVANVAAWRVWEYRANLAGAVLAAVGAALVVSAERLS